MIIPKITTSEPLLNWRDSQRGTFFRATLQAILCLVGSVAANSRPPNIIFIMADDLGYGDLGCYGSKYIATPHIDALAGQGTRYTHFYAGAPVCAPSRCVLMTGLHSGHGRIRGNSPDVGGEEELFGEGGMRLSLTGEELTVAEALRRQGYETGAAGKWGIGEPQSKGTPVQMGFDSWLGYLNQNHASYYYTDFLWENDSKVSIAGNKDGKRTVYSNDLFRDYAMDFIRENREQPFFLYLPITIPHELMEVPALGDYASRDWSDNAKIYAAMATRLDGYVGEIMDELDRWNLAEDTLLIFTSDNGPVNKERSEELHSAGSLRGRKGSVYEGGLRVPMIARWPGVVAEGETNETPWMFADVFPTLLEVAGEPIGDGLDGVSLLPTLKGEAQDMSKRPLYWEFPRDRLWQAARSGPWKAIRFGMDQPTALYNLKKDPSETRDVAGNHPKIVTEVEGFFDKQHKPSPHWPVN